MTSGRCSLPLPAGCAEPSAVAVCRPALSPDGSAAAACPLTAARRSAAQSPAASQPTPDLSVVHDRPIDFSSVTCTSKSTTEDDVQAMGGIWRPFVRCQTVQPET